MDKVKNVHCIGVGGIGVSAAAKWFLGRGAQVTGSDMHPSEIIDELDKLGVKVKIGHFADNVSGECDLVIYSRAVPATNVERQIVAERGIKELSYAQFLGELAKEKKTIAVSGTNGKSSTTSMIAKILIDAGFDPTVFVGSKMPELKFGNVRDGKGEWLVVEACEHMASMLEIKPTIAVVTNIEADHLDFYTGGIDQIRETFQKWVNSAEQVVLSKTDPESQKVAKATKVLKVEFGVQDRIVGDGFQKFIVTSDASEINIELSLPGAFNAMNAAAAVSVSLIVGVDSETIKKSLADYKGIWRRFEKVGVWKEADVYSDYAHHPTAIKGTIAAFKEFYPTRRLVVCFEPHQHSRTKELFDEFVESFDAADAVVLSEIYAVSGRIENIDVTSADLVDKIKSRGKINIVEYAKDHAEAESKLRDIVEPGDIIVIMGAGNIDELARKLAE